VFEYTYRMQQKSAQDGNDYFSTYHERHPDSQAWFQKPLEQGSPAGIVVVGVLDSDTASDFYNGAIAVLSGLASGTVLELHLQEVKFISSTGVGALTRLLAEAQGRGVTLRISRVSPACEDVFSVLGLIRYFNIPGVEQ